MTLARPLACCLLLALAACAGAGPGASFAERDPYRETNEAIHAWNLRVDRTVLRPVAQGYDYVTPTLVKHVVGNAFSHLDTVGDLANYALQGEFDAAATALGRFTVNTILGAGGLLDPATEFGLPKEDTDFGVTLGKAGVPEGAYIVLPFFGPKTTRDAFGLAGDMALDPLTYTGVFNSTALNVFSPVANGLEIVNDRAVNAELIDDLLYESDNSYISLRTVYLQRRDAMILGEEGGGALPDIFEDAPAN